MSRHAAGPRELIERQYAEGRLSRRAFVRLAALLGLAPAAASAVVARSAAAAEGEIRIGMEVAEISDPHVFSTVQQSNVVRQTLEYLTYTDVENVTRPSLVRSWSTTPDLRTWTFEIDPRAHWHDGRPFLAEDAVWNIRRCLDPATGSSVLGLMRSYILSQVEKDGAKTWELWDANAIEVLGDRSFRLNLKNPQFAVAEHLFHYPLAMMDPAGGGSYGPGANGTGPFRLVEHAVGEKAVLERVDDAWAGPAGLRRIVFIDLGGDPMTTLNALASNQIDGANEIAFSQLGAAGSIEGLTVYERTTARTAIARMKVGQKPFDDPRVRLAMRLAVDVHKVQEIAFSGRGLPGEHHHVSPTQPDYAPLPPLGQDVERAKRLLAEAGYPNGFDAEITVENEPGGGLVEVQAMVAMWAAVGARVSIDLLPSPSFWDVWNKVPFGYTVWAHRPLGLMLLGLAYRSGVPWNESDFSNARFDELLTQAEGELDIEKRRLVMQELEQIMQEDGPLVQPVFRPIFAGFKEKVGGYALHPSQYLDARPLFLR